MFHGRVARGQAECEVATDALEGVLRDDLIGGDLCHHSHPDRLGMGTDWDNKA